MLPIVILIIPLLLVIHIVKVETTDKPGIIIMVIITLVSAIKLIFTQYYILPLTILSVVFFAFFTAIMFPIKIICKRREKTCNTQYDSWVSEIKRKSFHAVVVLLFLPENLLKSLYFTGIDLLNPITAYSIDSIQDNFLKNALIIVTGALFICFTLFEFLRMDMKIYVYPREFLREHEEYEFAAYFYTAGACFFVSVFFKSTVIVSSITISLVYDAFSAIIGKMLGKRKIVENRTLEGTLAGFIVSTLAAAFFIPIYSAFVASFIICLIDIINKNNINDNLLFPITSAFILWFLC